MNEPRRLLEANSPASRLLQSGLRDNPELRAAHKAAVALGLGGAAATAASASAATGAIVAPVAAATGAGASIGIGSVAVKWVFAGFLGGVLSAGGAAVVGEATRHVEPIELPASGPLAPVEHAGAAVNVRGTPAVPPPDTARPAPEVTSQTRDSAEAVRTAGAAAAPRAARAVPAPPAAPRDSGGRLGRDLSRIDETRRALRAGDPKKALAQLDGYERARETSFFDREAMLLRIEALVQQGQRERASALADQYFQRFPGDVHAPRLRALLAPK
jgi:hypothetical protein